MTFLLPFTKLPLAVLLALLALLLGVWLAVREAGRVFHLTTFYSFDEMRARMVRRAVGR